MFLIIPMRVRMIETLIISVEDLIMLACVLFQVKKRINIQNLLEKNLFVFVSLS